MNSFVFAYISFTIEQNYYKNMELKVSRLNCKSISGMQIRINDDFKYLEDF